MKVLVIDLRASDGFLEDGRIRGDSRDTVLFYHSFHIAGPQEVSAQVVAPYRLSYLRQPP